MEDVNSTTELMQAAYSQLICTQCNNFIKSSIWQCSTGHNYCTSCFKGLEICPKCRSFRGKSRNYSMERLRPKFIYVYHFRYNLSGSQSVDLNGAKLLKEEIMHELKCQLCMNYMRTLVPQCIYGHNETCKDCFNLEFKCGMCFAPHAAGRNLSLERLLQFMHFGEGESSGGGCTLKTVIYQAKVLFLASSSCPMWFINLCKWNGPEQEIVQHFINDHNKVGLDPKCQLFLKRSFNVEHDSLHIFLCFAYYRLFKYIMCFDELEIMASGCNFFGDAVEDGRYSYEVSVLKPYSNIVATKFGGICGNVVNGNLLFVHRYRIDVDCSQWKQLYDGNGKLNIVLQLIDNSIE